MPIYNETFQAIWEKQEKIKAAKKLLIENGYEVINNESNRKKHHYQKD
jgi:hypothetical protein